MFFTQEDYRKIQDWLSRNSSKDSELLEATPLNGNEIISIVQANHNKKISIKDFVNQIFKVGSPDFFNVTDKLEAPYITLEEAINMLPTKAKKQGQVITFLNKEGNWDVYQFIGANNQCNIPDKWNNIFDIDKYIIDSLLPDEEDLTKTEPDEKGNSFLSFKDRLYDASTFSGLGKKVLRKHIIDIEVPEIGTVKKNILYQDIFEDPNTVYEIRYDFDLNGKTIELPENCILDFRGGSITNGTLVLNNTLVLPFGYIENDILKCNIEGTYKEGQMFFNREDGYFLMWDGKEWISASTYFRWGPNNTIQISRNNKDWEDLSEPFSNSLYIKGYVNSTSNLPSDALLGDIYMVGTGAPYDMYVKTSEGWKNNGQYTSITAGIEQTTGQSTTNVMSQKAVTDKFTELELELDNKAIYGNVTQYNSSNPLHVNASGEMIIGASYELPKMPCKMHLNLTDIAANGNKIYIRVATAKSVYDSAEVRTINVLTDLGIKRNVDFEITADDIARGKYLLIYFNNRGTEYSFVSTLQSDDFVPFIKEELQKRNDQYAIDKSETDKQIIGLESKTQIYDNSIFELGNIAFSETKEWTYSDSTSRVRIKEGKEVILSKGDSIKCKSGVVFYVGYIDLNGNRYMQGWITEFTAEETIRVSVLARYTNSEDIINVADFVEMLTISRPLNVEVLQELPKIKSDIEYINIESIPNIRRDMMSINFYDNAAKYDSSNPLHVNASGEMIIGASYELPKMPCKLHLNLTDIAANGNNIYVRVTTAKSVYDSAEVRTIRVLTNLGVKQNLEFEITADDIAKGKYLLVYYANRGETYSFVSTLYSDNSLPKLGANLDEQESIILPIDMGTRYNVNNTAHGGKISAAYKLPNKPCKYALYLTNITSLGSKLTIRLTTSVSPWDSAYVRDIFYIDADIPSHMMVIDITENDINSANYLMIFAQDSNQGIEFTSALYQYNSVAEIVYKSTHSYSGERIVIEPQLRYTILGTVRHRGLIQGCCAMNGLLFQFYPQDNRHEGEGYFKGMEIYDLNNGLSLVQSMPMGDRIDGHNNSVCFSGVYYDKSDKYPLIYSDNTFDRKMAVFRITETGNSDAPFAITQVQTISFELQLTSTIYTGMAADDSGKFVYIIKDENNPRLIFYIFNQPTIIDGDITLTADDAIDTFEIPMDENVDEYTMQGGIMYKGKVYYSFGFANNAKLRVYDVERKQQVSQINLPEIGLATEAEGVFIHNGKLCLSMNEAYRVVQFDFL